MIFVYNWKPGKWQEQLYYSIRALKKNFKDVDHIYILTKDELFFDDPIVTKIHVDASGIVKEQILINQIKHFCELNICKEFIYMCDDFFILKEFCVEDIENYPYLENLSDFKDHKPIGYWQNLLSDTRRILIHYGLDTFNYSCHIPSLISCKIFLDMYKHLGGGKCIYQWESGYFNFKNRNSDRNKIALSDTQLRMFMYNQMSHQEICAWSEKYKFLCFIPQAINDDLKKFLAG